MKILKIIIKFLKYILGVFITLISIIWILDNLIQESEIRTKQAYQEWYNNLPENYNK